MEAKITKKENHSDLLSGASVVLASMAELCASIKDQCDLGLNGIACQNGTASGSKASCDEAALCGAASTRCEDYLLCAYPSCSCSCDPGFFGEYCDTSKSRLTGQFSRLAGQTQTTAAW